MFCCLVVTGTESYSDDSDDSSLTWIFYVVGMCYLSNRRCLVIIVFKYTIAFGAVIVVVLLVIITIVGLKHIQIRRREFDKSALTVCHLINMSFCCHHSY